MTDAGMMVAAHHGTAYVRSRTLRKEKVANSGEGVANSRQNATYVGAPAAEKSRAVLNAADIASRKAQSLKLARRQRGLSQAQLAELYRERGMKMRRNEISRWENGLSGISDRNLLILVAILGHDLSWWYADHSAEVARLDAIDASAIQTEDVA
jgi:ribosome-binding protein aMBF1 (putative translation factor)